MTEKPKPKRTRRTYSDTEVEQALHVLAWENGNSVKAQASIEEHMGMKIPVSTLKDWREKHHVERYHAIREEVIPKIRARAAESAMSLAERQAEVSAQVLERIVEELPELPARDLAGALRNIETSKAINLDKHQVLTGAPTAVVEHRSLRDLVHGLERRGVIRIQNAEVIEHDELESGPDNPDAQRESREDDGTT